MKKITDFPEILAMTLDRNGPAEAIWSVENEAARNNNNAEAVDEVYKFADQVISDTDIRFAQRTCLDRLNQFDQMMLHVSTMEPEEWILAITLLSTYYCTHIFASRRGLLVHEEELANALKTLKECTSNFQDKSFRSALASARRHNPNPLPPFERITP